MNKKIIHSVFEHTVSQFPQNIAIMQADQQISFDALNRHANQLAHTLKAQGVDKDVVVALFLPASIEYIISLLAVAKAGGIFLPLDMATPEHRLNYVLNKTSPKLIITNKQLQDTLQQKLQQAEVESIPVIHWNEVGQAPDHNPELTADADDSVYLLFTSGSTGNPKAITGRQKSLSHFIHWEIKEFSLDERVRVSFLAAPTFDVSLRDMFIPLIAGGTLCIPPAETRTNASKLLQWMQTAQLTTVHCVPSLFRLILRELENLEQPQQALPQLERVLLAGEPLYSKDVLQWRDLIGERVELVNLYGPSESTLAKAFNRISELPKESQNMLPIGQPISNTALLIIKNKQLAGIGEIGEIHIKTPFLSNGYYRDPALTKTSFIPNPLTNDENDIVYKTGDLGRYLPDRSVEILGRLDNQVKINGIRIELGEIEQAMLQHPMIQQTIVIAHKNDDTASLVCYYTVKQAVTIEALRQHLSTFVPEYMIPSFFVQLDEFKLNLHGKIDRKALPKPEELLYERVPYVAPNTVSEQKLAAIWGEILGLSKVGVQNLFIDLGGDSLKAIRTVSKIYKVFEVEVSLKDFFEHATVQQLAQLIDHTKKSQFAAIPAIPDSDYYPVSHAQRRLWVLHQMDIDARAYNLPNVYWFNGDCHVAALEKAFQQLITRHEVLRTRFLMVAGELKQQVLQQVSFTLPVTDLSEHAHPIEAATQLVEQDHAQPFDLTCTPLMRIQLLKVAPQRHIFMFNIHHIISDVWSLDILVREMLALYRDALEGKASQLPPLRIQYKDYSHWQHQILAGETTQSHQNYWLQQFTPPLPQLNLPTDFPRPVMQTFRGHTLNFHLDKRTTENLAAFCQQQQVSLFTFVLAATRTLLYRYTGQEDIIIGSPIAGRNHPDLEDQIGFYVNTLALRDTAAGHEDFLTVLHRVKQNTTNAFDHQMYPFDRLVDELQLERDMSHAALFDVMVMLQNVEVTDLNLPNLQISPFVQESAWDTSRFDLMFHFIEQDEQLQLELNYNTNLFRMERVQQMGGHFKHLVESILNQPTLPLARLNILSNSEREMLLEGFNNQHQAYPDDSTVIELFEAQVAKTPDHIALSFENRQMTYRELNQAANRVAHDLLDNYQVQPDEIIAVSVERSEQLVIALLAVLKASAVYLPIDPDYPQERINFMLSNSNCRLLLAQSQNTITSPSLQHIVDLSKISSHNIANPANQATVYDLAFVIYTSGSTGQPKGVMIEHRGFVNMVYDQIHSFRLTHQDKILQFASASFDASLDEIFLALLSGASLVLISKETINNTQKFVQYLQEQAVSICLLPPVYLNALNQHPLPTLRILMTIGEPAIIEDVEFYSPIISYYNGYGPTETSICAALYWVNPAQLQQHTIPIGKPVANTGIYLLDANLNLLPVGVIGELHITGHGVSRGYLNNPSLTHEKFIDNPFKPGEKMYKTGDLGRWLPDGNLEFLGRTDHQVKISGHRIELSEIEYALRQHPHIQEVVVAAQGEKATDKTLTAYFTRKPKVELFPLVAELYKHDDEVYRSMATDKERNARYLTAFKQLKGKKVVEIGPGSEVILSRLCLEAGAEKIYAIELLEETYRKAQATLQRLGLEDRIILIHGDATQVQLPEKVDYCISEIVGAIGGSEGSAKIINDTRHLLQDGRCMIPQRSLTKIAAFSLPTADFDYHFSPIAAHYVEQIFAQKGYSFDLRLCVKNFSPTALLSNADVFEDLDYTQEITLETTHSIELVIDKVGIFTGFLVWLTLYTDAEHVVDILEQQASWIPVYLPIDLSGINVVPGDKIRATIDRKLCSNGLNPDFLVQGEIIRKNHVPVPFNYASYHDKPVFRATPFYAQLFADGQIPIQPALTANDLRNFLVDFLPTYMLPTYFMELAQLPLTPSGKVDKKSLPTPVTTVAPEMQNYAAPHTDMERKLVEVWCQVLNKEVIGIYDNYFTLGGDSIKAIQIVSKLHQEGWTAEVRDIFQSPTIAELALEIKALQREIAQEVVTGDVPLSPIQAWFFAQPNPALHHFNQSVLLKSAARLNADRLRTVFEMLQNHHDGLRSRYQVAEVLLGYHNLKGLVVRQEVSGVDYAVNFQSIDLNHESNPAAKVESYANALHESFNLGQGPLMKAILFHLPQEDQLFIVIHHLVVDGVSWRILLEDLMNAYTQLTVGQPVKLPLKTDSFKDYSEKLSEYAQTDAVVVEIPYWQAVESTLVHSLPRNFDTHDNCIAETAHLTFSLSVSDTQILLADAHHAYHTRIDDLLLTALALALKQWHSGNKTLIMLEKYGREVLDLNLNRTVGWFTSIYPFVLELPETDDLGYQIKFVKESLRKVPNSGLNYGVIKYLTPPAQRGGLNTQENIAQLGFNYLGQFDNTEAESSIFTVDWDSVGQSMSPQTPRVHDVDMLSMVTDGKLEISLSYHQKRYQLATIQRLATAYEQALRAVIAHCHSHEGSELTPDDLTYKGLSLTDLDNLFE